MRDLFYPISREPTRREIQRVDNEKKRKLTSKKRITVTEEEHVPVARGRIKEKTAGIHLRFRCTQLDLRRYYRRRYYKFPANP